MYQMMTATFERQCHTFGGLGGTQNQGGGHFNTSLNVQAAHPSCQITNIAIYFFIFLLFIIDTIVLPHLQYSRQHASVAVRVKTVRNCR